MVKLRKGKEINKNITNLTTYTIGKKKKKNKY